VLRPGRTEWRPRQPFAQQRTDCSRLQHNKPLQLVAELALVVAVDFEGVVVDACRVVVVVAVGLRRPQLLQPRDYYFAVGSDCYYCCCC